MGASLRRRPSPSSAVRPSGQDTPLEQTGISRTRSILTAGAPGGRAPPFAHAFAPRWDGTSRHVGGGRVVTVSVTRILLWSRAVRTHRSSRRASPGRGSLLTACAPGGRAPPSAHKNSNAPSHHPCFDCRSTHASRPGHPNWQTDCLAEPGGGEARMRGRLNRPLPKRKSLHLTRRSTSGRRVFLWPS